MKKYSFRVRFGKHNRLRFLSHHDLMVTLVKAVRRAALPVSFTEGFNPPPRMSYPLALGLGVESEDEVVEIDLSEWVPPEELARRLSEALPEDLPIVRVEVLPPRSRSEVVSVVYEIGLADAPPVTQEEADALLARREAVVVRRTPSGTREFDVRPYLLELTAFEGRVRARLKVTPNGTARPEEVLLALGVVKEPEPGRFPVRKLETRIVERK